MEGEYADEVYFIATGRINYTYGENNMVVTTMPEGSYFGEIEVMNHRPRDFNVISETN